MINKNWNSIIEVILVIVIVTIWIIWAYGVLNSWQKLAVTSENKIKAINIAREWMEASSNIRDTNWIKFPSDYLNCWATKDYNWNCIWNSTPPFILSWSYILIQSWALWYLTWLTANADTLSWSGYMQKFPVYFDAEWLISQNFNTTQICSNTKSASCKSIFTREIKIDLNVPNSKMKVNSIVKWYDWSKNDWPHIIDLESTLTNWKKNLY